MNPADLTAAQHLEQAALHGDRVRDYFTGNESAREVNSNAYHSWAAQWHATMAAAKATLEANAPVELT